MTEISAQNINTLIVDDVRDFFKNKQRLDLDFGTRNELEIIELIKTKFNDNTILKTAKFDPFDFRGDNKLIELKTRKNRSTTYPTTMIGMNKINYCKTSDKDIYFIFKFTDKIMYCQYDKDDFENFEEKIMGRSDRGIKEASLYKLIPISYLTDF